MEFNQLPDSGLFTKEDALLMAQIHLQLQKTDSLFNHLFLNADHENNGTKYFNRSLYPKHLKFFDAGNKYKLRLLMAGNRVGKTLASGFEIACHVTGNYPDWWAGKKFEHANNWWVCGVDSKVILSTLQPLFLGPVGNFGTGLIPYDNLDFDTLKDAKKADTPISMFRIKHKSGGMSSIEFKSYESGRESFQSYAGNIWLDEEPPLPIYSECLMRTMGDYIMMITFTPLKGPTDTILNFLDGKQYFEGEIGDGKHVTMATWDDVPHISEEDKKVLLAATPPWLREARSKGIPQMGSGAIYQVPLSDIQVKRFEIPKHWKRYAGMDVGNKTACIWFAIDPSTNTHYGYHEYYREGELPSVHVQSIAGPGKWIPIAIDHAAHGRSQIDGKNLFDMYEELGLKLHNADKSVETGLYTCWELLSTGKVKIFDDLKRFAEEYQMYRKDEKGRVVKDKDHIMDSFRYAMMTGRDLAKNEMESNTTNNYIPGVVSPQYRVRPII
jgi:phage terminase large subunit-like protein